MVFNSVKHYDFESTDVSLVSSGAVRFIFLTVAEQLDEMEFICNGLYNVCSVLRLKYNFL